MASEGDPRAPVPSPDSVRSLLLNRRRRRLLDYLASRSNDVATLDELREHLVAAEAEMSDGYVPSSDHREEVETSLVHIHLPKLSAVGVLEYDDRSETVRYYGDERLEARLRRIDERR